MSIWGSIKRLMARHDEELAENELMRESVGIDLSEVAGGSSAVPEASSLSPFPHDVVRPVIPDDESEQRA